MPTEFQIRLACKAAQDVAPGMGGFSARAIVTAIIRALDGASPPPPLPTAGDICVDRDGQLCRVVSARLITEHVNIAEGQDSRPRVRP